MTRRRILLGSLGGALVACGTPADESRLTSEAPLAVRPVPTPTPRALPPVRFPDDEGPHDVLAEWWYYTGHLYAPDGAEFGFELVFFRGIRGDRPPGYSAHFAITDLVRQRFRYAQRQEIALNEAARPAGPAAPPAGDGPAPRPHGLVALVPPGGGFDLALGDWWLRGAGGRDSLRATMPAYTMALELSATRPPALHLGAPPVQPGLITFGPAGYSYYYSRTRMDVQGTLVVDGAPLPIHGEAWMDHQWGDFLVLSGGGWDWFAGTLSDGRDLTISVIRDGAGKTLVAYGTLVGADGETTHLPPGSFDIQASASWTSPHTGITYPSQWRVSVPEAELDMVWTPLLPDQELDTRSSTGVIYWEGAVRLSHARTGADIGRGYVELTGYK